MNVEIEIKLLLDSTSKSKIKPFLTRKFKKVKRTRHVEYYLNNPSNTFLFTSKEGYLDALDYLRIRLTEKGDSVCFKHWHRNPATGKTTHCDEFESAVDDGKTVLELLKNLGYTHITTLDKTRTVYEYGHFEISLDEVKGLGSFMEVELKKKVKDPNVGLKEIFVFLKTLGLSKIVKMDRGYISMLWNPKYNFGETIYLT